MSKSQKEPDKSSILSGLKEKDLKSIKIAITRNNIAYNGHLSPLKRSMDSPENLKVHIKGVPNRGIFDREDIVVNKQAIHENLRPTKQRTPSPSNSEDGYVSHSPSNSPRKTKPKNTYESKQQIFKGYFNRKPPFPLPKENDDVKDSEENYPSTSKGYSRYKSHYSRSPETYRPKKRSPPRDYEKPGPSRYNRSPSYERKKMNTSPPYEREKMSSSSPSPPPPRSRSKRDEEYRSKRRESPFNKYRNKSSPPRYRKQSRSPEPPTNKKRYSRSPSSHHSEDSRRKYSKSPKNRRDRSRSQTPLRPGEYRPNYKKKSSTEHHKRLSPIKYRSRSPKYHHERSRSPHSHPVPYRSKYKRPYEPSEYHPGFYDPSMYMFRPPFMPPRFMPPPPELRPGHVLIPQIQYLQVPNPLRPPPPPRPVLMYNNRQIPKFVPNPPTTIITEQVDEENNVKPPGEGDPEEENK